MRVELDVVLPEVDGVELFQWLAERKSSLHLIVVTGHNPRYSELARKLGEAKGLRSATNLAKPVALAELRAALNGGGGG